jgi:hypothetical protein
MPVRIVVVFSVDTGPEQRSSSVYILVQLLTPFDDFTFW